MLKFFRQRPRRSRDHGYRQAGVINDAIETQASHGTLRSNYSARLLTDGARR